MPGFGDEAVFHGVNLHGVHHHRSTSGCDAQELADLSAGKEGATNDPVFGDDDFLHLKAEVRKDLMQEGDGALLTCATARNGWMRLPIDGENVVEQSGVVLIKGFVVLLC